MRGNGKVFISHAHEDNEVCAPLLAALDAWGVDYWFDLEQLNPGQHISERVQQAIADRDVFIRIGTSASRASMWTALELTAFRGLQIETRRRKSGLQRFSITLILDSAYKTSAAAIPGAPDETDVTIDTTDKSRAQTFNDLRRALDLSGAGATRRVSRRGAIGLGAAAAVAVAATTGAGVLYTERSNAPKPYPKPRIIPFDNPQETDPRLLWFYATGGSLAPAIGIGQDVVFVNSDDGLVALKAADGSALWTAPLVQGFEHNVPVVAGSVVYAAGGLGKIYALHAADGSELWHVQPGSGFADNLFALDGGVLYVLTDDGFIKAYNTADGTLRWQSPSVGKATLDHPGPAAGNGLVFVGSPDGNLYAFNAGDGSIAWTHQTGGAIVCVPTVAGGIVYFGSKDTHVYALNASYGGLVWKYTHDFEVDNAPVVAGGVAYIGLGVYLIAFDAITGKLLWQVPASDVDSSGQPTSIDFIDGQATLAGGNIYVCSGPYLYAFSASKPTAYTWRFQTKKFDSNSATPVVGNGAVYFGGSNSRVYALKTS